MYFIFRITTELWIKLSDNIAGIVSINHNINKNSAESFLTYETEFVLFLVALENSVLPMGWDSSHPTLKVTSEL